MLAVKLGGHLWIISYSSLCPAWWDEFSVADDRVPLGRHSSTFTTCRDPSQPLAAIHLSALSCCIFLRLCVPWGHPNPNHRAYPVVRCSKIGKSDGRGRCWDLAIRRFASDFFHRVGTLSKVTQYDIWHACPEVGLMALHPPIILRRIFSSLLMVR